MRFPHYFLCFVTGMILPLLFNSMWIIAFVIFVGSVLVFFHRKAALLVPMFLLGVGFQMFNQEHSFAKHSIFTPYQGKLMTYEAKVCSHPKVYETSTLYTLCVYRVLHEERESINALVQAQFFTYQSPQKNDLIRFRGRVYERETGFKTKAWSVKISSDDRWVWMKPPKQFRANTLDQIKETVSPQAFSIFQAMVLGASSYLPKESKEVWSQLGIIHLFVFSGFHVGVLFGLLYFGFSFLCRLSFISQKLAWGKKFAMMGAWALSTAYLFLWLDFSIPTFRAWTFLTLYIVCSMALMKKNILSIYIFSAFVSVVVSPQHLLHPSALLSFAAVGGILWTIHLMDRSSGWKNRFKQNAMVSMAAYLWTLPLIAYYFGYFNGVGFLYNIVLVPTLGISLITVSIALMVFAILRLDWLVTVCGFVLDQIAEWFVRITHALGQFSFGLIEMNMDGIATMVLFYVSLIITYLYLSKQRKNLTFKKI